MLIARSKALAVNILSSSATDRLFFKFNGASQMLIRTEQSHTLSHGRLQLLLIRKRDIWPQSEEVTIISGEGRADGGTLKVKQGGE